MDKDNQLKNILLFQNKGHFSTFKGTEKNEFKIVRTKKKEGTEIIKNKKGYNKAINITKNFLNRIIKMKKEIKRNEFYQKKDKTQEILVKKENKILKKIGTDLKNSIIVQLKNNNEFNFAKPMISNNNITSSTIISKKNRISLKEKDLNRINLNESLDDISSSKLLEPSKNNLEILNESMTKDKDNENEKNIDKNFKLRKLIRKGIIYDSYDDEEECEDQTEKDNCYIDPNSLFIIILDAFIFFITFYYLIYNPYYFSNSIIINDFNKINLELILNIIMEFIFIFDFILQFIRAYHDFDENLIKNNKKIIIHYLNSWFIFDLICIIPIFTLIIFLYDFESKSLCRYYCQPGNLIYLLTFIKMLKIIKILSRNQNKFVTLIESNIMNNKFFSDWGNLIFQIVLALIFLHITACIHIFIGRNSYPNWIIENSISEDSYWTIYISSIYFLIATLTSVGYGDITGYSNNEYIFQIFLLIIGIIAYSWLVSSISNYVMENNKGLEYFLSKVKILDEIRLSHPEMDSELYHKIYLYLKTLKIIHKSKDKDLLLDSLPFNLKYSILYQINKPLIEGLNFFKNFRNSSFILNAVTKLIPIIAYEGDIIIEDKEIINSMIFVKQGRLSVELAINMDEIQNKIDEYITGDFIFKSDEENSDNDNTNNRKNKNIKNNELKRNNTISLMTTLNFSSGTFDTNNKNPVSFRKRLQQFMKRKKIEPFQTLIQKKIKYIKLYYIRKGEQYGEIPMFLNKPSNFTLKVRSPKAELLFLKKIDAIEISSNYPHIWKRANKKSFKNFVHLKQLVSRELIKFCDNNGIKYNKNIRKSMKHLNSAQTKMKINEKLNLGMSNNKNKEKNKEENKNKGINMFKNIFFKNINKKEKIVNNIKENKKDKVSEKPIKNNIEKKLTPFKEFEINNEVYEGELFIDKNSTLNNTFINSSNITSNKNYLNINDFPSLNSFQEEENISFKEKKAKKDLIKLIDSSRTKSSTKLYYHKNKKPLFKNNNYNVQYNINNSFNIQNVQNNITFNQNKLTIINSASFKINKIYTNLNEISKGKYSKDLNFQTKVKNMFQKKYEKNKKVKIDVKFDIEKKEINKAKTNKSKSFFKRYSSHFSLKDLEKLTTVEVKRKGSFDKMNKDTKSKKTINEKSDLMLNQITQNIIDGDKNLNNPETFYNEMFKNIVINSTGTPKLKSKSKSSSKRHSRINKKISSIKKSLINNEENSNT